MNRREWIKLSAGALSGLALTGCASKKLIAMRVGEEWPDRDEKWIASACLQCESGCGILARVVDGQVVKLEGNPLHPINRGRLCPIGQASLQLLYNPDRIKWPMKRAGGKGAEKWVRISWDDALNIVAADLTRIREQGKPHSLVVFDGHSRGLMHVLLQRFCDAYGTPNHISTDPPDGMTAAHELAQGLSGPIVYDLENANYVLSFGCGLLDGWRSPVGAARACAYLRQQREGGKAKIIQVERRFSMTAAKADEWVPINPGTDSALALGIAYVMIREDLYDSQFVEDYTFGFNDWQDASGNTHLGFRKLVLTEYRPDDVAEITGVPVDTIIKLAKEFARGKPSIAIADNNATGCENGSYAAMAIQGLNALMGSIDVPGGALFEEMLPLKTPPVIEPDSVARQGLAMQRIDSRESIALPLAASGLSKIAANLIGGEPYEVRTILLCNSNPLFSAARGPEFRRAIEKAPLVVSFSSFADETASLADLILPDHIFLEKWQDSSPPALLGTPVMGIAQPVVGPLYDTMHSGDFLLKLAASVGGAVAKALPWADFKDMLKYASQGLYETQRGAVFSEPYEESYQREMQSRGWGTSEYSSYDEFWQDLVAKGGWSGLTHSYRRWGKVFNTPSRKYEFYSQILKKKLEPPEGAHHESVSHARVRTEPEAQRDKTFLPHYEPVASRASDAEYPFTLNPFSVLALGAAESANLPWIEEIAGPHLSVKWDSWAEINPLVGGRLGLADGDWIWIESRSGKIRVRAKFYPGAMPQVISVPCGLGHQALGRWAKNRGANPLTLLDEAADSLTALPARFSTRVKIYKA